MSTKELRHLAKTMRKAPLVTRLLWEIHRLRKIARQAEVLRRMLGSQPRGLYKDEVSIALERLVALPLFDRSLQSGTVDPSELGGPPVSQVVPAPPLPFWRLGTSRLAPMPFAPPGPVLAQIGRQ